MSEHADFDFTDQKIVPAKLLLAHQAQLTQLLKMVMRHAGTAEMQGMLDFSDALGTSSFE